MNTIGIDLGTTNSLVGRLDQGEIELFSNELEQSLIPSCIAKDPKGQFMVGRPARDRMITAPTEGVAFFKRDMGTPVTYDILKKPLTPTECSALVLQEMKRMAEKHMEHEVQDCVITVPAYFHDSQRNATIEAAKIAGLNVKRILNEPTAAALAYGYDRPSDEKCLLVFDLGGGTFDVSILEVYEGVVEILASGGESHLGEKTTPTL